MNGFVADNVACGGCHTLLTATKGSNADFTNNDFSIVNEENRHISLTELPPLQKVPAMNKTEEHTTIEDVANSNVSETLNTDNVNGNVNDETGSIDSLEANVSGSHIVNINDLDAENGSINGIDDIKKDEIIPSAPIEAEVMNAIETMDNVVKDAEKKIEQTVQHVTDKVAEKVEVVEETLTKTVAKLDPVNLIDAKKALGVPDKIAEIANSPPPKTPFLQELLHVPDMTEISPDLSKHSDDGQKSENGQSENETIPCGSDKSSPQAKTKMQAVMPIVRSEDGIDAPNEPQNCEDVDVVVNKLEEKGRFSRMFQSIRDKENSCMGKGKVIEEQVVGKCSFLICHPLKFLFI